MRRMFKARRHGRVDKQVEIAPQTGGVKDASGGTPGDISYRDNIGPIGWQDMRYAIFLLEKLLHMTRGHGLEEFAVYRARLRSEHDAAAVRNTVQGQNDK